MLHRSLYLLIMIGATSCNHVFMQRKYTQGFYHADNKKIRQKSTDQNCRQSIRPTIKSNEITVVLQANSSNQQTPKQKLNVRLLRINEHSSAHTISECGDTILLNNNKKVNCKVISIDHEKINYKDCRLSTRPLLTLSNKEIKLIKFENGAKEYFQSSHPESNHLIVTKTKTRVERKHNGLAIFGYIATLIIGIFTLFAFPIAGMIITLLSILGIFFLSYNKTSDVGYLISKGFGKFLGIIYLTSLVISVLAIILLIIAFA